MSTSLLTMTKLSPAARAVLTAVTQRNYCLDPEDVPQLAASIASAVATALRAAADQVAPCEECPGRPLNSNALEWRQFQDRFSRWHQASLIQQQIYAIANELDAQ